MDFDDFDNIPAASEEQEYLPPPPAVPEQAYDFADEQIVVAPTEEIVPASSAFDIIAEPEEDALT